MYDKPKKNFNELLDELFDKRIYLSKTVDDKTKLSTAISWQRQKEIRDIFSNFTFFTLINNNSKETELRKKANEKHPDKKKQAFKYQTNIERLKFVHMMENELNNLLIKYTNIIELSIKNKLSRIMKRNGGETAICANGFETYPVNWDDYLDNKHFKRTQDSDGAINNLREKLKEIELKYYHSRTPDRTHMATPYEFLSHLDLEKVKKIVYLLKPEDIEELASQMIIYRSTEPREINNTPLQGEKLINFFLDHFNRFRNLRNKIVHRNKKLGYKIHPSTKRKQLLRVFNNNIGGESTLIPTMGDEGKSDLYGFFLTVFLFIHDQFILNEFIEDISEFIKKYNIKSEWANGVDLFTYYSLPKDTIERLKNLKATLPQIRTTQASVNDYSQELTQLYTLIKQRRTPPQEGANIFSELSPERAFKYFSLLKRRGINTSFLSLADIRKLNFITIELNSILLKYILYFEKMLKSRISDLILEKYNSVDIVKRDETPPAVLPADDINYYDINNPDYFYHKNYRRNVVDSLNKIKESIEKNSYDHSLLKHYKDKKNHIPPWILFSELPLGTIRTYLKIMTEEDLDSLIHSLLPYFDNSDPNNIKTFFDFSMTILKDYRNKICHEFDILTGYETKYISKSLAKSAFDFNSNFEDSDYNRYVSFSQVRGYSALSLILMAYIQDADIAQEFSDDINAFIKANQAFFKEPLKTDIYKFYGLFNNIDGFISIWKDSK